MNARSPRPNRQEQSAKTRQTLLDVSLELFVHKGYAGTTVRDIAKKAKVSPGLMFHYFPSKQAILEEHAKTVDYGITSVVQLLASAEQPLETFRMVAKMILDDLRNDYSKHLFVLANQVLSLESIPGTAKRMVSAYRSIEASVPLIVSGQYRHEIKPADPLALAVGFWGALQGIAEVLVWNPNASIPDAEHVICMLKV
jgi:AcrR family transcriptional regulator